MSDYFHIGLEGLLLILEQVKKYAPKITQTELRNAVDSILGTQFFYREKTLIGIIRTTSVINTISFTLTQKELILDKDVSILFYIINKGIR